MNFSEIWREYYSQSFRDQERAKMKEEVMSKIKDHVEGSVPEDFRGEDFPSWDLFDNSAPSTKVSIRTVKVGPQDVNRPLVTPEEEAVISDFYKNEPKLKQSSGLEDPSVGSMAFNDDAWIQTYSGRRFNPTNPVVDAIVIQDIAHSLSMQCRFSGHVKKFYSVAQHSVLVSYICDSADAFWGLMHDASEAYLVDVPRPLKRSGKFDAYLEFESNMQKAICKRFGLSEVEPHSVKQADQILLSTEARDLMAPLRSDWIQSCEPVPFKIDPLPPQEAKDLFMKRFFELTNYATGYNNYLSYKDKP